MKKRILSVFLTFAMLIGVVPHLDQWVIKSSAVLTAVQWIEAKDAPYYYIINNEGGADLVRYVGDIKATNITIPDKVDGLTVMRISGWDFTGKSNEKNVTGTFEPGTRVLSPELTSYTAKDSVPKYQTIPTDYEDSKNKEGTATLGAYYGAPYLVSVTIPKSVIAIDECAFYGCIKLKTTNISSLSKLTDVGRYAFYFCLSLTEAKLPASVETIGILAFSQSRSLKTVTTQNKLVDIGKQAFEYCTALESFTMKNSVTSIGESAFKDCSSLKSISISKKVSTIKKQTFQYCLKLTEVTLPEGSLVSIGDNAFQGTKLKTLTVPEGVTSIGKEAFEGNPDIKKIYLPSSLTKLGNRAFENCPYRVVYVVESSYVDEYCQKNSIDSVIDRFTVSFNLNGYKGTAPAVQVVSKNGLAKKPTNPKRDGYKFGGWYSDSKLTKKWDFSKNKVSKTTTLYAKWTAIKPSTPKTVKAKAVTGKKVELSWKAVDGAKGYIIYRATSKNGSYKKVDEVKSGSKTTYTDKSSKLKAGKTYYYKIRAYKTLDGKEIKSSYSKIVKAKAKK